MLYVFVVIVRAFGRANVLQRLSAMKDFQLKIRIYTARPRNPILILTTDIFTNTIKFLYIASFSCAYIRHKIADLQRENIKIIYFGHI